MLQRIYPPKQKMYYPKSNTVKGQRQKVIKAEEHLKTMVEVGYLGYDIDDDIPNHSVLSKARTRWGIDAFQYFVSAS